MVVNSGQWEITPIFKEDFNNDIIIFFRNRYQIPSPCKRYVIFLTGVTLFCYLNIWAYITLIIFMEMFMNRMYSMLWLMHYILCTKKVVISLGRFRNKVNIGFWKHFMQFSPQNEKWEPHHQWQPLNIRFQTWDKNKQSSGFKRFNVPTLSEPCKNV